MAHLIVSVEGVEIKRYELAQDRTTLGRRPDNDIVLENMVVSGHHCVFEQVGVADIFVEDLGSTNGTYINGRMARREKLRDGDLLGIGNFRIKFHNAAGKPRFEETSVMKADPQHHHPPGAAPGVMLHASFKVLSGSSAGLEVPVVKAVTTFGQAGKAVVAVSHRRTGFFVALMEGELKPTINGRPLTHEATPLAHEDVLDLAGTKMQFLLQE